MILQKATGYYEILLEQGKISPPGWDDGCKVSFGLNLDASGNITDVVPYQQTVQVKNGKEKILTFRNMCVPARVKRSTAVAANFLCDASSYILGIDGKNKPERTEECFEACRNLHRKILKDCKSPAALAMLAFFASANPDSIADNSAVKNALQDLTKGGNIIFCFNMEPVTKDPEIIQAWELYHGSDSENAVRGKCLVTGKEDTIARLHPAIGGIYGAQSSGASLVSFNSPSSESYGHIQGENAPVGEYAAFAYTAALKYLVSDPNHCRRIGDMTVVCWADGKENSCHDLGMAALFGPSKGLDENVLSAALSKIAKGEPCEWDGANVNPDEHFYLLGISPNAARLSVRFFFEDSFGKFAENISRHCQDVAIVRPAYDNTENLPIWKLLKETLNPKSKTEEVPSQMAEDVLKAVLYGTPYPTPLLNKVMIRIRAEQNVTRGKAAIIKAYYLRHPDDGCPMEALHMELNRECTDTAYALGRMFSVYEQVQKAAKPDIKATIKDRYFISASSMPATIFPMLGNLSQSHFRLLQRDKKGLAVKYEKELEELAVMIGAEYPARLSLAQQGSFQLGYYFETQALYTKKEKENV